MILKYKKYKYLKFQNYIMIVIYINIIKKKLRKFPIKNIYQLLFNISFNINLYINLININPAITKYFFISYSSNFITF